MKRLIVSTSSRAEVYQTKHSAGYREEYRTKALMRKKYVESISDKTCLMLESMINQHLFEDLSNYDLIDQVELPDGLPRGVKCTMRASDDCIKLYIDVFGPRYGRSNYGYGSNYGLEWLADLQSGGDGSKCCIYVSKMPMRMKRKMNEYKDIIASFIEDIGFDVLSSAVGDPNGFWFPVINDEYEAML